jgi:Ser/Thr protein kinase RdoA (MazF antagonist)
MKLSAPLDLYGLDVVRVSPLRGGTINAVYKIETANGESRVLKRYRSPGPSASRLQYVCSMQAQLRESGLPVPRILPAPSGELFAEVSGELFVLSEFVTGRRYLTSRATPGASLILGREHARLLDALADYPFDAAESLPDLATIEARLLALLALGTVARGGSSRAEQAYLTVEQRLRMLYAWRGDPPATNPQWIHGDFTLRNVLFEDDEVRGIVDFDNLRVSDRAHDVMRCFTLSFSNDSPGAMEYFRGYARASGIDAEDARRYVSIYHYISLLGVWPADVLFENPQHYRSRWDQFLRPRSLSWENGWDVLAARLADLAAS